jgi:hypothetical protein
MKLEGTMRPLLVVIPELSTSSLQEIHDAVRRLAPSERTEPDWLQTGDALEAELRKREVEFEPIEWADGK